MSKTSSRLRLRNKRKERIRKRVNGSTIRPRLTVFRSTKHIYAQVIDDTRGVTLASISSFGESGVGNATVEKCRVLGVALAEKCKSANVSKVVFDKNGYEYHGRVAAFATGAREGGLQF